MQQSFPRDTNFLLTARERVVFRGQGLPLSAENVAPSLTPESYNLLALFPFTVRVVAPSLTPESYNA